MGNNLIAVIGASAMQILTLQAIEGLDFGIIHQPTGDGIPNTTVVKSNTVGKAIPASMWKKHGSSSSF